MHAFSYHSGADNSAFRIAATIFTIGATLALVAYAFLTQDESLDRARTIVQGCEAIVAILVGGLAMHLAYLVGMRHATGLADRMTRQVSR